MLVAMPAASLAGMRRGLREHGPDNQNGGDVRTAHGLENALSHREYDPRSTTSDG